MEIKICGLTNKKEAEYLNEAKVDYAGFVFYDKSKRNLNPSKAKEIMAALDPDIKKVAVMVSPDEELIASIKDCGFDIFQIHKELREEILDIINLPVWYAVNISDEDELNEKTKFLEALPERLYSKIEALVVDAPNFGSGKTFNWKKSKRLKKAGAQSPPQSIFDKKRFILAGGLNKDNVSSGIETFNPDVVDVSSGVEGVNGKERELILEFVKNARA